MELPVSFADYTRTLLGDEDYKELVTSLESEQSVSIRLNPLKPFAFRSGEHAVPWCTSGFYLEAGDFVHTLGDAHIYLNHLEQVKLQLSREPRTLPQMKINPDVKNIFDFKYEDFELVNYNPHPHIAGKVAV